jgi:hypothetical protein
MYRVAGDSLPLLNVIFHGYLPGMRTGKVHHVSVVGC